MKKLASCFAVLFICFLFTENSYSQYTVSITSTNVSCKGGADGTATATPVNGTGPTYTYAWSTSPVQTNAMATGLSVGDYTVTVTDNGTPATATVTIAEPAAALTVTTSQTNGCNGANNGTATAIPSGGTGSTYTYLWSAGSQAAATATGLSSTSHTVLVKDSKGCAVSATVTIVQPPVLVVPTPSQTNITCNGANNGTSSIGIITGGTPSYIYLWTGGQTTTTATGLSAGSYSVKVTDVNGCTKSSSIINIIDPPVLSTTISQTPGCNGGFGTATVNAAGGTGAYTYAWNTSPVQTTKTATGLSAGNYSVTVTDANGCLANNTTTIVQSTAITLTTTPINILCNGGKGSATVNATGGAGGNTYIWNTSPAQNTQSATGLSASTYTVTVTDVNGCSKTASVTITQPPVLVLPAPTATMVTCFGSNNGKATANATGGTGALTYLWTPGGQNTQTATGLAPVNYTVTVTDANGCTIKNNITITQPTLALSTTTSQTPGCNGGFGTATVNATGGTGSPSYTYLWTGGQITKTATGLSAGNYNVTVTDANGCSANNTVAIVSSNINLTTSQTNVLCNGGKGIATAIASLGAQPYTYSWSPSGGSSSTATGLSAGNYAVTVTEAMGCSATATVIITQPPVLTLTVTKTNILCAGENNGTGSVTPSGGASPYTYAWIGGQTTTTATGLSVGAYTVTVTDANGCSKSGSINITQPANLLTTTSQTNGCNLGLGTATVNPSGGNTPYTYLWNSSPVQTTKTATGLPVGNYAILVTDANGCTTFNAVVIVQLPVINLTTSQTTIACSGGKATATANATGGAGAFSYLWTPGGQNTSVATGLSSGSYTVTVTDANLCSVTATVSITQPAALVLTVNKANILCNGGKGSATADISGGTLPYTYIWSTSPVQSTATATGLDVGNYSITVTDANGCTKNSTTNITQPNALVTNTTQLHIYDGTTGSATATTAGGTSAYTYNWSTTPFQSSATATGLYAGNYTVTVTDGNGCTTKNPVTIISTKADKLAAGFDHSLSKCQTDVTVWGKNNYGQLGDGTIVSKDTAIVLTGLTNVNVLEGGGVHSLALKNDGNIWVWGRNNNGQLGIGNTTNQSTPVVLNSLNKIIAISGGNNHSVALKNDGTVWTWGLNANGQLGDNTLSQRTSPVKVNTITNVMYVASGSDHSLAIINDSTVIAWGANASGQLGDKSTTDRRVPVKVKNISGVIAVDGGSAHSLALKNDGTVWAWGLNADGQLGDGTNINKDTAVKVFGLTGIIAISAGDKHSLALRNDGTVWAWGLNADGQLGDVTNTSRNLPVNVNGLAGVTSIQGGGNHSLAVKNNGQVWAWGKNLDGQLGNKTNTSKNIPVMTRMPCLVKNLAVTTAQVNIVCHGGNNGTATAMPSGGALPYKYSWSTSPIQTTQTAMGLLVGIYSVTVTDANTFTSIAVVVITEPLVLTASVTVSNVSCFGANDGIATVNLNGGTPNYQYLWNSVPNQTTAVATGLKPGNYTAYISDANGCTVTTAATITQSSAPLSINVVGVINASSCSNKDGSIITTASGGVPNYVYAWSTTPVQTTSTAAGLGQGTYTLTVTDANNCKKTISDAVTCPTGINTLTAEIEFSVYPNPSTGKYQVSSSSQLGIFSIEVYSLLGEKVNSITNLNAQIVNEIDISQQPVGVYFLHIITKDGVNKYQDVVKKIIKD